MLVAVKMERLDEFRQNKEDDHIKWKSIRTSTTIAAVPEFYQKLLRNVQCHETRVIMSIKYH